MRRFIYPLLFIGIFVILFMVTNKKTGIANDTILTLNDGEVYSLTANRKEKDIGGIVYRMYAYNGKTPGPIFRVKQNAKIQINFTNNIDMDTTIHWHGLRLENSFDGVPQVTQKPVKNGESFLYELSFPDAGMYWYHPHVREDIQQERGLYGGIIVDPMESELQTVSVEIPLIFDDMLTENKDFFPSAKDATNFALMGRFGNVFLINGREFYETHVKRGSIVRFYLLNAANVRPFNISIEGIPLKVVGSDVGLYEKEFLTDSVIIGPAERYIVDAFFDAPGEYKIFHKNPERTVVMGKIIVDEERENKSMGFSIKDHKKTKDDIQKFSSFSNIKPEKEFLLTIDMRGMIMPPMEIGMHGGIEWEDSMFNMNMAHTNRMMEWIIKDEKGKKNEEIEYTVPVGSVKKIRIINTNNSMHPMQHSIHLHGQRFLVVEENGKRAENLVWKDTVMIPAGSYADILVDFNNPGKWMFHCHIAEHLESGMMAMFVVGGEGGE